MDAVSASKESTDLPAELRGPTPRRVRFTGTGWLNVFAALLFSLLGVAFGVSVVEVVQRDAAAQDALRQSGAESLGQIQRKWTRGTGRHLSYTFVVDGTVIHGESKAPVDIWEGLHQTESLPVRYLPANPKINHPAAWEESPNSRLWLLWISAFLLALGLMFVRRIPLQRRIAREGIAVRGCVSEREWKGASKGQPCVSYTFRNASNDEVEIGSCPYDFPPKAGSSVWVLYLAKDPRRSEIYPFGIGFFRIEG